MKVNRTFRNHRMLTLAGAIAITLCSGAQASPPNSALALWRNAPGIGAAVVTEGSSRNIVLNMQHGERARYTVILKEEPVATYDGLTSGYAKIPLARGHVDTKSSEAARYVSYLQARQNQFLSDAGTQIKRPLGAIMQFQHAVNGVVVELTSAEAAAIAARDDVLLVDIEKMLPLMTDRSTFFIGADKIWDGSATGGVATQGEGIVIGDIDSGINYTSPSFAGTGPLDGYQHVNPLGAGNYLGLCKTGGADVGHCNDKLIGLYDFVYSYCSGSGNPCGAPGTWTDEPSATDSNGHGSHTASTAAGNHTDVTLTGGNFTISGVAPHASIVAYDACYTVVGGTSDGLGRCPSTSTTAAANQAVADGIVDILTYSIGGGTSPWTDATSMAFLGAQNAGIFVVAAAGNDGPTASTVSHVEPWVATAAASTDDQVFGYTFNLNAPGTPPGNTVGLPVRPGANPQPTGDLVNLPITQSPGFANGNNDGCTAFANPHTFDRDITASERIFADGFEGTTPAPIYQKGIAVLHLDANNSGCGSVTRRSNALNAGAAGVIFVDNAYINLGASGTSYSMIFADWNNVYAQIVSDPANATASVVLPLKGYLTAQGDVIADFSSRGPAAGIGGQAIVKPEIAAPGVAILAAYMGDPGAVAIEDGTSMATPHIAGSAALLRALHPTWSPTQIRSAMMLTAKTAGVVNQNGSPAAIWDRGSGRIDLPNAAKASLLFDETGANFLAANPATNGKISTLNLPSIADSNCIGPCTYTRTVRSAHTGGVTYTLSVDGFPAGTASVAPASFVLSTSGSKSFTVTVQGDQLPAGQYVQGQVTFTPSDPSIPVQHIPVAVKPGGPAIQLSTNTLSATQDLSTPTPVAKTLNIANIGNPTLNWMVGGSVSNTLLSTATSGSGYPGGYYPAVSDGLFEGQAFDVNAPTHITSLRANGFVNPGGNLTTANTTQVTFAVFGNATNMPDGLPMALGGNAPVWTYSTAVNGAGVSVPGNALLLNLNASGVPALDLTSGRYWFVAYPTMNTNPPYAGGSGAGWYWRLSPDAPNSAKPVIFETGDTGWSLTTQNSMSAQIVGMVACTTPSWISVTPPSGSLGYAANQNATVSFDPTGLSAGTYTGSVCISSNATNTPTAIVNVTFTVTAVPHKVSPSVGTPAGTISPNTDQTVNFNATTQFTLTPDAGNHIDNVGGTCPAGSLDTGTGVYTTGAIVADCSVIANFAPDVVVTHQVTSSVATDPSWGSISPSGVQTVNDQATPQFTLNANGGYHLDTVGGTCGGSLAGNVFTTNAVTADCSVIASFAADAVVCPTGSAVEATATAGTAGPTGYPTLKDAFDAINAGTHTGAVTLAVCGNTTETAPAVLNASGSGSASYAAVSVKPDGGAARSISGAIAAGSPLVDLNGAANVTIDGLNSGGNALTLANTTASNTAGTSTVRFINGANANTVKNTSLQGSATGSPSVGTGTVLFSTSATGGNSNNMVSNNDIGPAGSNLPSKAVQGLGSANNVNTGNTISGNKIHDFFAPTSATAGVSVDAYNTNWTISNNRIYQTAARTFTSSAQRYSGIAINSVAASAEGGNFVVTGNTIGFGAADGTGTTTLSGSSNEFRGIAITGSSTDAGTFSTIQGNTISGIVQTSSRASTTSSSSAFIGIQASTSAVDAPANILGNTIGSLDGSSSITINATSTAANTASLYGIYDFAWVDGLSVSGNNIGSITVNDGGTGTVTGLRGIFSAAASGMSRTISNNTVGGALPGSITNNLSGGILYGIQTGNVKVTATGNVVQNLTSKATAGIVALEAMAITSATGSGPSLISGNTVRNLNVAAGSTAGALYAIDLTLPQAGNVVEKNTLYGVSATSAPAIAYQVYGMFVRGTSIVDVRNNVFRMGFDAAGNAITAPQSTVGIRDTAGAGSQNNYYYNSIYIGGTGVTATASASSYAFNSDVVTTARNFQDNIFWNARSNAVGGGFVHVAIKVGGTAPNPAGLTSDHNILLATGTDGVTGVFNGAAVNTLTDWQTATGQDATSIAADPLFVAATAATPDLHVQSGSPALGAGTPIASVSTDFAGTARSATTPTIGAYEVAAGPRPAGLLPAMPNGAHAGAPARLANAPAELPADGTSVDKN